MQARALWLRDGGALSAEIRGDKIVVSDQRGRELPNAAPSAASGSDLEELEQFLRDADLHIDANTGSPGWSGSRMDLGDSLAWLLMAHS